LSVGSAITYHKRNNDHAENSHIQWSEGQILVPTPLGLWNRTFGGPNNDEGTDIVTCSGGGFALVGSSWSFAVGDDDVWLIRTDVNGNHLWNQTYGGTEWDVGYSLVECSGGGFAICGHTGSFGGGHTNVWLIRTDASGTHLWNKTYGGSNYDSGLSVFQCSDSGFVITGITQSYGGSDNDVWVIRTDSDGNIQWSQVFGGSSSDQGYSIIESTGGDLVVAGISSSYGVGDFDAWLIRLDSSGNHIWNYTYGSVETDRVTSVIECQDGGYALAGYTRQTGGWDAWVVKTNNNGIHQWNQTYSASFSQLSWDLVELSDGSFAVSGETEHPGGGGADLLLIRTDSNGNHQWNRTFGGPYGEFGYAIANDSTGFVMVGKQSNIVGTTNLLMVRIPDRVPPYWVIPPGYRTLELGTGLQYQFDATFPGTITQWEIDDTTNFAINSQGILTNNTILSVGFYVITVSVEDSYGEQLTGMAQIQVLDTMAPVWDEAPVSTLLVYLGQNFQYDLDASDLSGIDKWWLNDTAVFSISNDGVIENRVALIERDYGLIVSVNDTYGNTLSTTLTVMVRSGPATPGSIPGFPFEAIAIGFLFTLTLIFVNRRWKKK
jgi:hypothetical protein